MNVSQFASLVRAALLLAGGYLVKHGITDAGTWEIVAGFLVGLIPLVWSWFNHSTPAIPEKTAPPAAQMRIFIFCLLCFGGLWCAGCKTADRVLLVQTVTPAATNAITGVITPAVTNAAPSPTAAAVLATGQGYAAAAPAPWGWIASGVLALATVGLGLYAKARNGQLSESQDILTAVIAGVEAAGTARPVKAAIQEAAAAAGVEQKLYPLVQAVTAPIK